MSHFHVIRIWLLRIRYIFRTFILFCLSITTSLFFFISNANAWNNSTTHPDIMRAAYNELSKSAAFQISHFPRNIKEILAHEGYTKGTPDWDTKYSEHYYNPKVNQGGAPEAVERNFGYLIKELLRNKDKTRLAKAAAWSAHFMADIHCPFHLVGWRGDWVYNYTTKFNTPVYGSLDLCYACTEPHTDNFPNEVKRFLELRNQNSFVDWFDPWYYNFSDWKTQITKREGSHQVWEMGTSKFSPTHCDYQLNWENPVPTYEPWSAQAKKARLYAIENTKKIGFNIKRYYDSNPKDVKYNIAIGCAVRSVYNLWRASFSALKPTWGQIYNKGGFFEIIGQVENLERNDVAKNVRLRLTADGCKIDQKTPPEQKLGDVVSPKIYKSGMWTVKDITSVCILKLEVIGQYKTPDLQYAFIEKKLNPPLQIYIEGKPEAFLGEDVQFTAKVKKLGYYFDPAKLGLQWKWRWNNKEVAPSSSTGSLSTIRGRTQTLGSNVIIVEAFTNVQGKWEKAAEAKHVLTVKEKGQSPPAASVTIKGETQIKVGSTAKLNAQVTKSNVPSSDLYFKWFVNGKDSGTGSTLSLKGTSPGTYRVTAELWMKNKSGSARLAQADHTVTVEGGSSPVKPPPTKIVPPTEKKLSMPFDTCIKKYCLPQKDACSKALCQKLVSGCASPCIQIYTADACACGGACKLMQEDQKCVEPYMGGFLGCLSGCWRSSKPAVCGYDCLGKLKSSFEGCRKKTK